MDKTIFRISPYSAPMRENTDQKNSEYGHFARRTSHGFHVMFKINPFQPSVTFYMKTIFCCYKANQMTGFCAKYITGLKKVKD